MESPGFDVEQNTLGGDSDDSSYKAYESGTSYSDSFEFDGDRVDEPKVELVGEMIQKELDHLLGSSCWGLEDDFDSNNDDDLNNDMDYDKYGNKKRVGSGRTVSRTKCMRAKIRALELVQGYHKAQYANIYDYLLELKRSNLSTTIICKLDRRLFQRLYVCLEECKFGWLTSCRRIIGLDGCWLKGYYDEHLLTVVGVDAYDCIYPVAFAVVESENKQSWFWFLELLQRDLEIDNSYNICFMSNKQKGLIKVISLLFPNAKARNCARHLYNNFKNIEGFKGQVMRLTYWKAAKATFPRQFEEAMSEMRSLSESAEAWLCDKDSRTWSRAHFSTRCKSDLLLNNNSKCFNKAAGKYPEPLCPRIQKKLSEIVSQSNNIWLVYAGNEKFEVDCGLGNKHVVDLLNSSCPMQWEHVRDMEPILPLIIRRPPGRPKQTRRKEVDEAKKSGPKLSKTEQQDRTAS
ncbi:hypothetical protein PVK06_047986 [Gossypium arboreum]|uniref:MULE transposase domain-containing protein n=1 Tax=Gossypium arboreum TaxID=29729 RepID=A0ABR0MEU5_GOSAR|nr:hypothetical protein PVK06_047986 [Gossypium arboreum]